LIYLRNDGSKDFLRQKVISYEANERYFPQSNKLAKIFNLTIMDKARCMLSDTSLTSKLWPCAVIYNDLHHSALEYHKKPNDDYGYSSDFSKLYVFGSICYALQPSKFLHELKER
jgi:hypothetical protein